MYFTCLSSINSSAKIYSAKAGEHVTQKFVVLFSVGQLFFFRVPQEYDVVCEGPEIFVGFIADQVFFGDVA